MQSNESLQSIDPSQVKKFFRKVSIISHRYAKKLQAIDNLNKHLDRIEKTSSTNASNLDVSELKYKINDVLAAEKRILRHKKAESDMEWQLRSQIHKLKKELNKVEAERDKALIENRKRVHELSYAVVSLKAKIAKLTGSKKAEGKG